MNSTVITTVAGAGQRLQHEYFSLAAPSHRSGRWSRWRPRTRSRSSSASRCRRCCRCGNACRRTSAGSCWPRCRQRSSPTPCTGSIRPGARICWRGSTKTSASLCSRWPETGPRRRCARRCSTRRTAPGSLMDTRARLLRAGSTAVEVRARMRVDRRPGRSGFFVVDSDNHLLGRVDMQDLALAGHDETVDGLVQPVEAFVQPMTTPGRRWRSTACRTWRWSTSTAGSSG